MAVLSVALALPLAPARADFSGIQNHDEWQDVTQGQRRVTVNDACNCSGTWTGDTGIVNGEFVKEYEYLHSNGFSTVWFHQTDDGFWRAYYKKRWVDFDGPDQTVFF
jgi:hypothetical protein